MASPSAIRRQAYLHRLLNLKKSKSLNWKENPFDVYRHHERPVLPLLPLLDCTSGAEHVTSSPALFCLPVEINSLILMHLNMADVKSLALVHRGCLQAARTALFSQVYIHNSSGFDMAFLVHIIRELSDRRPLHGTIAVCIRKIYLQIDPGDIVDNLEELEWISNMTPTARESKFKEWSQLGKFRFPDSKVTISLLQYALSLRLPNLERMDWDQYVAVSVPMLLWFAPFTTRLNLRHYGVFDLSDNLRLLGQRAKCISTPSLPGAEIPASPFVLQSLCFKPSKQDNEYLRGQKYPGPNLVLWLLEKSCRTLESVSIQLEAVAVDTGVSRRKPGSLIFPLLRSLELTSYHKRLQELILAGSQLHTLVVKHISSSFMDVCIPSLTSLSLLSWDSSSGYEEPIGKYINIAYKFLCANTQLETLAISSRYGNAIERYLMPKVGKSVTSRESRFRNLSSLSLNIHIYTEPTLSLEEGYPSSILFVVGSLVSLQFLTLKADPCWQPKHELMRRHLRQLSRLRRLDFVGESDGNINDYAQRVLIHDQDSLDPLAESSQGSDSHYEQNFSFGETRRHSVARTRAMVLSSQYSNSDEVASLSPTRLTAGMSGFPVEIFSYHQFLDSDDLIYLIRNHTERGVSHIIEEASANWRRYELAWQVRFYSIAFPQLRVMCMAKHAWHIEASADDPFGSRLELDNFYHMKWLRERDDTFQNRIRIYGGLTDLHDHFHCAPV